MEKIKKGDLVVVNYTGKLEDGTIFDTSLKSDREPLKVTLGQGSLIKGFEDGLINMSVGEKKTIHIEHEDAYGPVKEDFITELDKNQAPEGITVGESLEGMGQNGPITVRVTKVTDEKVTIDANHPLAGKKLIFDLEVVSVN